MPAEQSNSLLAIRQARANERAEGFLGFHAYVTNGVIVFDHRGYSIRDRLLEHHKPRARRFIAQRDHANAAAKALAAAQVRKGSKREDTT